MYLSDFISNQPEKKMSLEHHLNSVAKLSLSPLFLWYGTALGIDDAAWKNKQTDIYMFTWCVLLIPFLHTL